MVRRILIQRDARRCVLAAWSALAIVQCGKGVAAGPQGASDSSETSGSSSDAEGEQSRVGSGTSASACIVDAGAADSLSVGTPCVPSQESDPSFADFSSNELTIGSDETCSSGLCLANHFGGRVSCPYGQDVDGSGPPGVMGCLTVGSCQPVRPNDPLRGQEVPAQCFGHQAIAAVYCTCRCANAVGAVDDAGPYCSCPSGMTCAPDFFSGSYCIKAGTTLGLPPPCDALCAPATHPCQ
jgi:hypothetical protein